MTSRLCSCHNHVIAVQMTEYLVMTMILGLDNGQGLGKVKGSFYTERLSLVPLNTTDLTLSFFLLPLVGKGCLYSE